MKRPRKVSSKQFKAMSMPEQLGVMEDHLRDIEYGNQQFNERLTRYYAIHGQALLDRLAEQGIEVEVDADGTVRRKPEPGEPVRLNPQRN